MVERQVVWSLRALNDKFSIYEYWTNRNHSITYAAKLERLFKEALSQVVDYPTSGRKTDKEDVRILTVNHFSLFYSSDDKTVFVLALFDTRRDEKNLKL
jgi:toxin YoeB